MSTELKAIDSENNTTVIMPYKPCQDIYIEELNNIPIKPLYSFLKRLIDIVFSLIALLICAVPMILISVAVKITSKGTIFYHQERLGINGKKINVIKFRSMQMDAEKNGLQWSDGDDDPRVTSIGRFLRQSRLDELPQFWCILKGDMSLVGPRPERELFYNEFEQYIHGFSERLKVKPGLTGLAQVKGLYLKPEEKIMYDVEYIKKRGLALDLKLIIETVVILFKHKRQK